MTKAKCEGCGQEKEVKEIDGHLLCESCIEDVVRCRNCDKFLAISFDDLEIDNFGNLRVPELKLPGHQNVEVFCNKDCLIEYLISDKDKEHMDFKC